MDAQPRAALALSQGVAARDFFAAVVRLIRGTLLVLLLLAAVWLVVRRMTGGLAQPLAPGVLVMTAWSACTVAAMIRLLWRYDSAEGTPAEHRCVLWLPAFGMGLLAAAVSLPGTPTGALVVFCAVLLAEEIWAITITRRFHAAAAITGNAESPPSPIEHERPPGDVRIDPPHEPAPHFPAADVIQQITRRRAPDGTDEVRGHVRVDFAAHQRFETAHLAFCPPLPTAPSVSIEQVDGPPVQIKQGQQLPYGMRLDLKLKSPFGEPIGVVLEFVARAASQQGAPAHLGMHRSKTP